MRDLLLKFKVVFVQEESLKLPAYDIESVQLFLLSSDGRIKSTVQMRDGVWIAKWFIN